MSRAASRVGDMIFRRIVLILFAGSVLLHLQCDKDDHQIVSPETGVLIPLKTGNEWFGQSVELDTAGNVTSSNYMSVRIGSDTIISGERWYRMQSSEDEGPYDKGDLLTNRSTGVWFSKQREPYLMFKYPAIKGERYVTGAFGIRDTFVVISTGEPLDVEAGEFSCYHYRLHPGASADFIKADFWIAAEQGIVKMQAIYPEESSEWTLDSMSLK